LSSNRIRDQISAQRLANDGNNTIVLPLSTAEQAKTMVRTRDGVRKIIVSTNIATGIRDIVCFPFFDPPPKEQLFLTIVPVPGKPPESKPLRPRSLTFLSHALVHSFLKVNHSDPSESSQPLSDRERSITWDPSHVNRSMLPSAELRELIGTSLAEFLAEFRFRDSCLRSQKRHFYWKFRR
jgi:hypothetical protein